CRRDGRVRDRSAHARDGPGRGTLSDLIVGAPGAVPGAFYLPWRISPSFLMRSAAASTISLMSTCAPFGLLLSLVPAESSLLVGTSKISVSTRTVTSVRLGEMSMVAPHTYG